MKILILCTGNSCRSQMAQAFLQSFDPKNEVHSAGTEPAKQLNQIAVRVMQEIGIDICNQKPKSVNIFLKDEWDYVITVCDEADKACPFFPGKVGHRLHISFEDPSRTKGTEEHILSEFRRVRDDIKNRFYTFYKDNLI